MTRIFSDAETQLLREIQQNASLSLAELSARCDMAQSTVWRKMQEYESSGLIRSRVALLDPAKVGCSLTVLADVTLCDHSPGTTADFARCVKGREEIVECLVLSGDQDYQLKIRVRDVAAYQAFLSAVLSECGQIRDIRSSFVLSEVKSTTQLPL